MKTGSNYFISYIDVLNSLSGDLPAQDLKGTGFEFPWVGSSQKSCKNSEPRPAADADLKRIDIFYIKHPKQDSSLCLMAAFYLQAIAGHVPLTQGRMFRRERRLSLSRDFDED